MDNRINIKLFMKNWVADPKDSPQYFHQSDYDASQWDDIKYTFAQLPRFSA